MLWRVKSFPFFSAVGRVSGRFADSGVPQNSRVNPGIQLFFRSVQGPEGQSWILTIIMAVYNSEAPVLDNYQAVVSAYCDFLTVVIHTILYERNIYPQTSFIKARKYNYPVRQSRHPKLCKWIMDAVSSVEVEMLKVKTPPMYGVIMLEPKHQTPSDSLLFKSSWSIEVSHSSQSVLRY